MAFQPGDAVGDYEVVEVLGAGGMGAVYKVRNVISDRIEAMKVLLPDLATEPELADRFLREIKVQASLDHPNIAKLHTALRAGNQLIMVMELVEGATLEQMMQQGRIPLHDGLGYISEALEALAYAHEQGVIHRDIKPANIMLTNDGVIKLLDFGIAKAAADRKLTMTGTTMGSLYYMSPEQVRGQTNLDARSDLYSLGITLYEVATGQKPFTGDSDYSIMSAHLQQAPEPPIQADPTIPPALNEIILQSIAKEPEQRFQSARAFRNALESVRGPAPAAGTRTLPRRAPRPQPQAPPPRAAAPPSKPQRGLWVLAGSVLTLVILLAAGIEVANWRKTRAGGGATVVSSPEGPPPPAQEPPPPAPAVQPPAAGSPAPVAPADAKPRDAKPTPLPRQTPVAPSPAPAQPVAAPPAKSPAPPQTAPAPPPQTAPPGDTAALQELRERAVFLGSRASTVRAQIANLERSQARMGVGLRPDMAAANQRMDFLMKEAAAALSAGDAEAARRNLDLAEREVEKLEKFLGR